MRTCFEQQDGNVFCSLQYLDVAFCYGCRLYRAKIPIYLCIHFQVKQRKICTISLSTTTNIRLYIMTIICYCRKFKISHFIHLRNNSVLFSSVRHKEILIYAANYICGPLLYVFAFSKKLFIEQPNPSTYFYPRT